jgi:hypothetical protein
MLDDLVTGEVLDGFAHRRACPIWSGEPEAAAMVVAGGVDVA